MSTEPVIAAPDRPVRTATALRERVGGFLSRNGALVALALLVIVLASVSRTFLTVPNLTNVLIQASVVAILAFGMTLVIVTGGIDLSVGSVAALSAMCAAWLTTSAGIHPLLAVVVGLCVGVVAGSVSGIMVAFGRLPSFIATMAMLSIARGLTLVVSDGRAIPAGDVVSLLGSRLFGWLPMPVVVMAVMGLIAAVLLNRTVFGRAIFAIGGNEEAARLSGIPVRATHVGVYAVAGLFAAVAGLVLAGRLSTAQPQAAAGYELDAIAAVVIGGASLAGGVGRITGTLIGALVLAVIRNGLNLLNVNAFWQEIVIGAVIAIAVLIDVLRRKKPG
ncbi:ABC transporter permease [Microbacterium sp.]|uniref:ABC transporter permease n=1 Tax=Microbacterium sp. TaxID=51671 RepID=UPI003C71FC79